MPTTAIKRKFRVRGRQRAFARFARVHDSAVSQWLHGISKSARLDSLAKSWQPQMQ